MLNFSNIKPHDGGVIFDITIKESDFLYLIPSKDLYERFDDLCLDFYAQFKKIEEHVADNFMNDDYLSVKRELINSLFNDLKEIEDLGSESIKVYNLKENEVFLKTRIKNLMAGLLSIDGIVANEVAILERFKESLQETLPSFRRSLKDKIEMYKEMDVFCRKPLTCFFSLYGKEKNEDYTFYISKFNMAIPTNLNAKVSVWAEQFTKDLRREMDKIISRLNSKKGEFLELVQFKLSPLDAIEQNMTVEGFLNALSIIKEEWSEEFLNSKTFAYHFYNSGKRSPGEGSFLSDFNNKVLSKLNHIGQRIEMHFKKNWDHDELAYEKARGLIIEKFLKSDPMDIFKNIAYFNKKFIPVALLGKASEDLFLSYVVKEYAVSRGVELQGDRYIASNLRETLFKTSLLGFSMSEEERMEDITKGAFRGIKHGKKELRHKRFHGTKHAIGGDYYEISAKSQTEIPIQLRALAS